MSNEGRWRHEGNAFEQPGADATRPVPAADGPRADGHDSDGPFTGSQGSAGHGASAYGSDRTGGTHGAPAYGGDGYSGRGAGAAPTYQPSYGGGSGGDLPPGDGGRTPRGGGFPWLAIVLGVLAVAAAATAVWFFLLRDSGDEEPTTDDSDIEVPSGESGSDSAEPTEEDSAGEETPSSGPTEDETATGDESDTDPQDESETDDGAEDGTGGAESPSNDADGPGTPDDATILEIGETHTLENGMEVTLDEVERDAECATSPGEPFTALTFTVVAHDDELVPAVPPLPGITVSTSEGDISAVDVLGCIDDTESLPPVLGPGEEATGTVLVPDPVEGSYDVIYRPVTNIVSGGDTEALAWTID